MKKQVIVPSAGESITEGVLSSWLKQEGSLVKVGDLLAEIETDKATVEINAPVGGALHILAKKDQKVKIGEVVAEINESEQAKATSNAPAKSPQEIKTVKEEEKIAPSFRREAVEDVTEENSFLKPFPSPSAGRIIEEKSLDVSQISGSGKDGRIIKSDVQNLGSKSEVKRLQYVDKPTNVFKESLSPMKKALANYFRAESERKIIGTLYEEINMSELLGVKEDFSDEFAMEMEEELSYIVFFLHAASLGLDRFPVFKSTLEGDDVHYHSETSLALSLNGSEGENAMVVLQDVDIKGFGELEQEIRLLEEKASENKLSLKESEGGIFSIVSSADQGSFLSVPSLYGGQSGTLCLHRIEDRAIVKDGEVQVAPVMQVSLSYNKLLVDDHHAVDFLVYIKSLLEKPVRLLLYRE